MTNKKVKYDIEAREGLKRGVDELANAVKVTLGPKGRNVIIGKPNGLAVTKDGVSVAKEINLEDPLENMGCQMVKTVASKTNDLAGDGTTTATVLAQSIITLGLKNIAAGANPMDIKRGMDKAVSAIIEDLENQSETIALSSDKIQQVATISANNDEEIGDIIARAFQRVGEHGVITVEESKKVETYVDIVDGMELERGYLSTSFVNVPEKMSVELEQVRILIYDKKITNLRNLLPLLEQAAEKEISLLIIAEEVDSNSLGFLVQNKIEGNLKSVAIKTPGFGDRRYEILEDIAMLTGGTLISDKHGLSLEEVTLNHLGYADKIIVTRETTIIRATPPDLAVIGTQVSKIKAQLEEATEEYDINSLKARLAKLAGGVAVLYVGAASEVEMGEKKDRVDDALHATRAAIEEGIVAGGGVALLRAKGCLKSLKPLNADEKTGIDIIAKAIESPLRTIVENAGLEASVIIAKVLKGNKNFGYNAKTGEFCDMFKEGIIDPKKVTRVALENATSVAAMILTTECVLVPIQKEDPLKF